MIINFIELGELSGGVPGFVYLLHFPKPFKHARHYLGFTTDLDERLRRHQAGRGSKLVAAVTAAGIYPTVVRVWRADGFFEQRLKRLKNGPKLCPICRGLIDE